MSHLSQKTFKFCKEHFKSIISERESLSKIFTLFDTRLKNLKYDYETIAIMKKILKKDSNGIDVGCHKGDLFKKMIKYSPKGRHFGFEPIPQYYKKLQKKFGKKQTILGVALSDHKGKSDFNHVTTNPAYSGLKKRTYDYPDEKETKIMVETDLLDNLIPKNQRIDFIKIDVEGGELQVLKGGIHTITKNKPFVIFEHGLGAAEHYDTTPEQVYDFFEKCGMKISLLEYYIAGRPPLDRHEFLGQFYKKYNYYFIATP